MQHRRRSQQPRRDVLQQRVECVAIVRLGPKDERALLGIGGHSLTESEVSGKVFGYAPWIVASFHLSLFVPDLERSTEFFTKLLGGTVTHRDESGYVNVDLFGTQLTLAPGDAVPDGFHFGLNVGRAQFDAIAERLSSAELARVVSLPRVVDEGTPLERVKMYVRCPAGYLVELKGV